MVAAPALLLAFGWTARGLSAVFILWLAVLAWWSAIPARNDRGWQADVARLPRAVIEGDSVTIENVRDFEYRSETDFTERWEERTYDLSQLLGVDLFLSFWGPTLIAHTIVSWEFADGRHLAISIETRKESGETYSALLGFFRQYELYYVVADEEDVVGLRARHRGEEVYLYRLRGTPEFARRLLLAYLAEVNRLAEKPRWYNALTHNCTTSIRLHVQEAQVFNPWDWRILANGKTADMLHERGTIDTSLPLAEMRARSDVTARARAVPPGSPGFSAALRTDLPPRPAP